MWRSTEIAVNPADTSVRLCACWGCVYISLLMNEQRGRSCGLMALKVGNVLLCASGPCKKICLIAITPPSIQTGTRYHSAWLLEETSERLLQPLTLLPFFHMNSLPSATAHSASQTSLPLKKIQNKEWGNEFYCPIFPPSAYWQRHRARLLRLLLCYYLKRGRQNEFYSLWSYLSPQTAPCLPSEVAHSATLSPSHYLTQRLEMNFTAHALSSLPSTVL